MGEALCELYARMPLQRRRQFCVVLGLMILGAFAELATIGAVVPFLSVIGEPLGTRQPRLLEGLFEAIGVQSRDQKMLAATTAFALLALTSGALRLQLSWASQRFAFQMGHEIAVEMQRRVLFQPYQFHVEHNSSALTAGLDKVGVLVFCVLLQLMQAAIAIVLSLFIIAALIYVNPFAALLATSAILSVYLIVSGLARNRLERNSKILGGAWTERAQIVQESLGGIRDVLIGQSQAIYLEAFRQIDARLSMAKANTGFIAAAPRFIIEAVGMTMIAAVALFLAARAGGLTAAIPVLGALAVGAQRLLPLVQQIFVSWSMAAGNDSVIRQVLGLLRLPIAEELRPAHPSTPLVFDRNIEFTNVSFSYPGRSGPAIDRVSLEIRRGERLALIGRTGSGKSTLADLIMGLLEPAEGQISIDGTVLTAANRRRWRMNVAHVPQNLFLADTSIAANIAFGARACELDLERVVEAATKAQLHAFVAGLPHGYDSLVGERGVRLSGGERQRLGLARAFYRQCDVLVLDEATSALDEETEAAVLQALDGARDRTIVMIAHRLSNIARADRVLRMDHGRLATVELDAELSPGLSFDVPDGIDVPKAHDRDLNSRPGLVLAQNQACAAAVPSRVEEWRSVSSSLSGRADGSRRGSR